MHKIFKFLQISIRCYKSSKSICCSETGGFSVDAVCQCNAEREGESGVTYYWRVAG